MNYNIGIFILVVIIYFLEPLLLFYGSFFLDDIGLMKRLMKITIESIVFPLITNFVD